MSRVLRIGALTSLAVAALCVIGCGAGGGEAALLVTVQATGVSPVPIASLLVESNALDEEWMDSSTVAPSTGEAEISLPTTFGIQVVSGRVEVCVTARDAATSNLALACASVDTLKRSAPSAAPPAAPLS